MFNADDTSNQGSTSEPLTNAEKYALAIHRHTDQTALTALDVVIGVCELVTEIDAARAILEPLFATLSKETKAQLRTLGEAFQAIKAA